MLLILIKFQLTSKNRIEEQDAISNWPLSMDLVEKVHRSHRGKSIPEGGRSSYKPHGRSTPGVSQSSTGVSAVRTEPVRGKGR